MENLQTDAGRKTTRDFFLYLFATGALYFSAVAVISLLWQYINRFFPDPLAFYDGLSEGMRWSVAVLIIVFPVYVFVMRFLGKDLDKNPEKRDLLIRKIMIYLTLFIAAVAIIVDLVMLVYNFLGGDLTARFAFKALSVLVVSAAVFKYYLFNLKREPGTSEKSRKLITWAALGFVLVIVVGAFFVVGSPAANRLRKFDSQRVSDLQNIQWQIVNYWQQKQFLPAKLADLEDPISGYVIAKDPETGADYEYSPSIEDLAFELCATFATESIGAENGSMAKPVRLGYEYDTPAYWKHSVGRSCFSRVIDPEMHPPYPKPVSRY